MLILICAFLIGVVAGLRALTSVAAIGWAARLGGLHLAGTPLAFFGYSATPYVLTVLALGEIVNDKLPKTPSRKAPPSFIARLVCGGLAGAAIGLSNQSLAGGLIAGLAGAVAGTFGGYEVRVRLAKTAGKDLPIALLEDAVAVIGAWLIVSGM